MKGKRLASGHGIEKLLEVCYKYKWTHNNTVLIVKDKNNLDSYWTIYEKI